MGAQFCKSDACGQRVEEDIIIQVSSAGEDVACQQEGKQMALLEKPKEKPKLDKSKKAASFAASVSRLCKQEMTKAWGELKLELETQKLVLDTPSRKAREKASFEEFSNDLEAVLEFSQSDIPNAALELESVLSKHHAVLSRSITLAGNNIKRLVGLMECREELGNVLLARSGQIDKRKVLLTSEDIVSIVDVTELSDRRLASDIKKLLTMIDLDPETRSDGTASTGLPST
eukprot:TRINITY_DN33145_c0_g1_i1.p1 TRINITY_DN33145_c0_g1~~TRINITY_DN33145_c0_g1_i1.p1  ORF type:complete len:246 (+),score=56.70 TRINITY_DN33145_c0_g1_i1:48-740(+)